MKTARVLSVALLLGTFSLTAIAQEQAPPPKTPRMTHRQVNQQRRIKQGVKSGELTHHETVKLEKEQAKIKADKLQAKSDGKVTPKERRKIRREQNKASRDIYRAKHNDATAK